VGVLHLAGTDRHWAELVAVFVGGKLCVALGVAALKALVQLEALFLGLRKFRGD